MIKIKTFTFNAFQENTYILFDETKEAVIIDPGAYEKEEKEQLKAFISEEGLKVVSLLNTHCHVDHVLGNNFVKQFFKVKLGISKGEEAVLNSVKLYAPTYGFVNYEEAAPDFYLKEGDRVTFGTSSLSVLFVPGHAPGHIAFYNEAEKILLSGDVLFHRSIGRYDLPGGDYTTLMHSIKNKLLLLPADVQVFAGHGPVTTIGEEKAQNPFLNEN